MHCRLGVRLFLDSKQSDFILLSLNCMSYLESTMGGIGPGGTFIGGGADLGLF